MDINKKLVLINKNTLEALEEKDTLKIVEKFTNTGIQVLSGDYGFMFWKAENQNVYHMMYVSPTTPYTPKLPRERGYNYKASMGRIPYFIDKPKRDILPHMKSLAIIPIFYKSHQYGNIVVCFKNKRNFNSEDESLAMTLSNSTAQVLTIQKNNRKTEKASLKILKQKDEFFNIVSHELKTPVTTIKGFSQLLEDTLQGKSDDKTRFFLEKINTQTDKLVRLVNNLLEVSRLESGKLSFEKNIFEFSDVVRRVVDEIGVTTKNHPISFTQSGQFWIHGDSQRIEEVLTNLITNAAKYSGPGSKIKVSLREKSGNVLVEVEDFGYGISEMDHVKVFNRSFRSKLSNKKNLPGLGLGLYIANSIVKHHGGNLDFKSKKQSNGCIFYFTLPYYKYHKIIK